MDTWMNIRGHPYNYVTFSLNGCVSEIMTTVNKSEGKSSLCSRKLFFSNFLGLIPPFCLTMLDNFAYEMSIELTTAMYTINILQI